MTDNRTNEPTEAQVEAAAKAAYEFDADVSELFGRGFTRDFDGMPQWAKDTHLDKARAALVAAQGAAPQAQSEYVYCPIHGDLLAARRSFVCEHAENGHEYAAPVLPSSTVDEAALARVVRSALPYDVEVAPARKSKTERHFRTVADGDLHVERITNAIAEYLTGGPK